MSTLIDRTRSATYENGFVTILMDSGLEYRFPASRNPRLRVGTDEQLANIVITPFGVHWPDLDEDLSLRGIQVGEYGQDKEV